MLVLTRKVKEQIQIGENIVVTIVQVRGKTVRVGIEAPKSVRVVRAEIGEQPANVEQPAHAEVPAMAKVPAAAKVTVARHERIEAEHVEAPSGFSAPFVGCVSHLGESTGLYPFVRQRAELKTLTTSNLVSLRG